MPIKSISTTPAPGHLIHICAACGAEHTISFNRGAQKTRSGPFALEVGDTLTLRVDAGSPVTVVFTAGAFPDFARVTAGELAAQVHAAVPGVLATDDAGGVLLESATTGDTSRIEIVGGTARVALGLPTDDELDLCQTRPVLGVSFGEQLQDKNLMALRRCSDCGAQECLVRTHDTAPPELAGTHFHEHRKAVNALAEHYKANGWSHPDLADQHAAETIRPPDLHAAFPSRLVVVPPHERANREAVAAIVHGGAR